MQANNLHYFGNWARVGWVRCIWRKMRGSAVGWQNRYAHLARYEGSLTMAQAPIAEFGQSPGSPSITTTAMTTSDLSLGATVIDAVLSTPVIVPPVMLHLYFKSVFRPLTRTAKGIGASLTVAEGPGAVGGFNTSIFGQQLPIGAMLCLRSLTKNPLPSSGMTTARGA